MTDAFRHDYRLSLQADGYFADALERALVAGPVYVGDDIRFAESYGGGTFAILSVFDEDARPHFFPLSIRVPDGDVSPDLAEEARQLFAQLVVMDDAARAIPRQHDENEELAGVILLPDTGFAVLQYISNLWNSEWDVHFQRDDGGAYRLLGIPHNRNPGAFIA